MGVFEAWKEGFSKSKLPLELHFEHIESKLKGFDFKFLFLFYIFFPSIFVSDVKFKPSWWNGNQFMKNSQNLSMK